MDMLDSALSEAADDMFDCDFETEEGELVSGDAVATAIEEAIEAQPKPTDDIEDLLADVGEDLLSDSESAPETTDKAADEADDESDSHPDPEPESDPDPQQSSDQTNDQTDPSPAPTDKVPIASPKTTEPLDQTLDTDVQDEIEALEESAAKAPAQFPAWFERSIEIIRPKIDKLDPLKGKTMDAAAMVIGTVIVATITHAAPIAARLMILISKPLEKLSPGIRNGIGYISLWTGFLAVALWLYLLMFRTPNIPHPETAPTRVINADESLIVQPMIEILP